TNGVVFSPDGKLLASASMDRSIRLHDSENGKEMRKFAEAKEEPGLVAFAGDGKTLVSAGKQNAVLRVWDVSAGKEVRQISGPQDRAPGCRARRKAGRHAQRRRGGAALGPGQTRRDAAGPRKPDREGAGGAVRRPRQRRPREGPAGVLDLAGRGAAERPLLAA